MTRLELDLGAIGRVSAEGDDPRDIFRELEFWRTLPTACPVCGAPTTVRVDRVKAKEGGKRWEYFRLRCAGTPRHETTLGQYQDGGGLFYRESRAWTEWTPGALEPEDDEPHHPAAAPVAAAVAPAAAPAPRKARPAAATPPRPAQAPPVADAVAPSTTADGLPIAGLQLRAVLTRRYGILGPDHQRLAEAALARPLGAWTELDPAECEAVEQLAAQVAAGELQLSELGPA